MSNKIVTLFLAIAIIIAQINQCVCEDYCFATDEEQIQLQHFATKTAYQIVKGLDSSQEFIVPSKPFLCCLLGMRSNQFQTI
jgi:hypothetical protein